ncbi:uncharacterized protein LOC135388876 isoform X1 [Ornithodoros turicata]|uniref:uncharacterized protein LOC135388876 isoform X1 n=1 Tax=Ornithodoros turicata TaxID=34597 RepID=UPI00313A0065
MDNVRYLLEHLSLSLKNRATNHDGNSYCYAPDFPTTTTADPPRQHDVAQTALEATQTGDRERVQGTREENVRWTAPQTVQGGSRWVDQGITQGTEQSAARGIVEERSSQWVDLNLIRGDTEDTTQNVANWVVIDGSQWDGQEHVEAVNLMAYAAPAGTGRKVPCWPEQNASKWDRQEHAQVASQNMYVDAEGTAQNTAYMQAADRTPNTTAQEIARDDAQWTPQRAGPWSSEQHVQSANPEMYVSAVDNAQEAVRRLPIQFGNQWSDEKHLEEKACATWYPEYYPRDSEKQFAHLASPTYEAVQEPRPACSPVQQLHHLQPGGSEEPIRPPPALSEKSTSKLVQRKHAILVKGLMFMTVAALCMLLLFFVQTQATAKKAFLLATTEILYEDYEKYVLPGRRIASKKRNRTGATNKIVTALKSRVTTPAVSAIDNSENKEAKLPRSNEEAIVDYRCHPFYTTYCSPERIKFYFKANTRECAIAGRDSGSVDVCNHSPNKFRTLEGCVRSCLSPKIPFAQCSLPAKFTACTQQYVRRKWWYYDEGRCQQWTFRTGECPLTSRAYSTLQDCVGNCSSVDARSSCRMPSGKLCAPHELKYPYFAVKQEDGTFRCEVSDFRTLHNHNCLIGPNQFATSMDCERACGSQPIYNTDLV